MSPLTRLGDAHPHADVDPGCALVAAARRKRHQTYPELARARRCRLIVIGVEVGGPPAEALCDGPAPEPPEVLADTRWD